MASLITSIREGKYDEHLDRIATAIANRKKLLSQELFYELEEGEIVRYKMTVRPVGLRGVKGKVISFRRTKIVVQLLEWAGRWSPGTRVVTNAAALEKVTEQEVALQALGKEIAGVINSDG